VGVDVLQDTKDAAAPAVAAAALAVAMAAASSHGQTQPHQQKQQQQKPILHRAVPSAGMLAPPCARLPHQQQQQSGAQGPRAMLWRPWGCEGAAAGGVAAACSSIQPWIPAAAVATASALGQGQVCAQSDQPYPVSPVKGSRLWRQQHAGGRVQQQQQWQGTTCSADTRLLHPERGTPLLCAPVCCRVLLL
jgi:hypothetical protein